MQRNVQMICAALFFCLAAAPLAFCQQAEIKIFKVDLSAPGIEIPSDFLGLSFESKAILRDAEGRYPMFRASNEPLIELFQGLGIGNLRIGGNTSDRPEVCVPDERDMDELFGFAKKAGVHVIYTLRLRGWSPEKDVAPARYLMSHYTDQLSCIAIGNEPDMYEGDYKRYSADTAKYFSAIAAVAPNVKFCGPGTTPTRSAWARNFTESFGSTTPIKWITQHAYPASYGDPKESLEAARQELFSPEVMQRNTVAYAAFGPEVNAAGLKYRIEETNSDYRMGGREGVSDSFASALWALDYMYWWASRGAQGINFHTGDTVAVKGGDGKCIYAVFRTAVHGYDVRPLGYAMKAFALAGRGRLLPVAGTAIPNVSVYAVAGQDGNIYFTLIDKARSSTEKPLKIILDPGFEFANADTMLLTSPDASLASTRGITLGGAGIGRDGKWSGRWRALNNGSRGDVTLLPDTALLVRFQPTQRHHDRTSSKR